MGDKSFWLAGKREPAAAGGVLSGTYVERGEDGIVRVEVGDAGNVVNVPSGGGVFEVGARVGVQVDASGVPIGVLGASEPPKDWRKVEYVGAAGAALERLDGELDKAAVELSAAEGRLGLALESAKSELSTSVAGVEEAVAAAAEAAKSAVNDATAAKAMVQAANEKAATAQSWAQSADGRVTIGSRDPVAADGNGKPNGAVWEVSKGGVAVRRFLWDGGAWRPLRIGADYVGDKAIGTAQIADLAVGTAQIGDATVTDAKIASLDVGKLRASTASIDAAVMGQIVSDRAFVGALAAERVVVAGGNLFPDPRIAHSGDGWWLPVGASGVEFREVEGIPGKSIVITASGSESGVIFDESGGGPATSGAGFVLEPGGVYRLRFKCRFLNHTISSSDAPVGVVAYWFAEGGAHRELEVASVFAQGGVQDIDVAFTFPKEAVSGESSLKFVARKVFTQGSVAIGDVSVVRAAGATLIEPGAVTTEKIAAGSVTAEKIKAGAVTAGKIAAGAVTAREIVASDSLMSKLAVFGKAFVTGLKANNVTITGDLLAKNISGKSFSGSNFTFRDSARNVEAKLDSSGLSARRGGVDLGTFRWDALASPPFFRCWWGPDETSKVAKAEAFKYGWAFADVTKNVRVSGGFSVVGGYFVAPMAGWYQVQVLTRWYWETTQPSWAVCSAVWRSSNPTAVNDLEDPTDTRPLMPGVTTMPTANGVMHLRAGEGIVPAFWQNTGSWRPDTIFMSGLLVSAD